MGWITVNGNHIFVKDGQTPRQAVARFIARGNTGKAKKYKAVKEVKKNELEQKAANLRDKINEISFSGGIRAYNKKHNTKITSKDVENWKDTIRKGEASYVKRNTANYNTRVKIATTKTAQKSIKETTFKQATKKREATVKKQTTKQKAMMTSKILQLQKELKSTKDPKRREFLKSTITRYKKQIKK